MGKLTWDPTEENQKNPAKEFFFFSSSNLTKREVIAHYSFDLNFPDYQGY